MKRFAMSNLVLMVAMFVLVSPAESVWLWCKADPVVRLNGTDVQILVAVPEEYTECVNGPVYVKIATPRGTKRELIYTDPGFNGHGEAVRFIDGTGLVHRKRIPTSIEVQVTIDRSQLASDEVVPVQVEVKPANGSLVTVQGNSDLTKVNLLVTGS